MEEKIDLVKKLHLKKEGIGPYVLLCFTIVLSPIACIHSFYYMSKTRINRVPALYITDNFHLGYYWSLFIFLAGIYFFISYSNNPAPDVADQLFFYAAVLPWLLSSFPLMMYQIASILDREARNILLKDITISRVQKKTSLEKNIHKTGFKYNITDMLKDLKENAVIDYRNDDETIYIEVLNPYLKGYCLDENDSSLYEEWECKSCGANYRTSKFYTENFQCEYCGTEKPA